MIHNSLHTGSATGYVQAVDARLSMGGELAVDGNGSVPEIGVRTGVLYAPSSPLQVTGTSSTSPWQYAVAPGSAVTSKGALDGPHIVTNDGTYNASTIAPPASNSRYDVIYIQQTDSAATISPDGATAAVIAVVNGTAGATPAVPAAPSGAVILGVALVASTAAAGTSGAGVTITGSGTVGTSGLIAPYTVARGAAIPCRNSSEYPAVPMAGLKIHDLALGYSLTYTGAAWAADSPMHNGNIQGGNVITNSTGYVVIAFSPLYVNPPAFIASVNYNSPTITLTTESVGTQYATIRTWTGGAYKNNVPCQWIAIGI